MTPLDGAGRGRRSHAAVSRAPIAAPRQVVILALLLLSALPTLAISLISIPSEKTFDDLREDATGASNGCGSKATCAGRSRRRPVSLCPSRPREPDCRGDGLFAGTAPHGRDVR